MRSAPHEPQLDLALKTRFWKISTHLIASVQIVVLLCCAGLISLPSQARGAVVVLEWKFGDGTTVGALLDGDAVPAGDAVDSGKTKSEVSNKNAAPKADSASDDASGGSGGGGNSGADQLESTSATNGNPTSNESTSPNDNGTPNNPFERDDTPSANPGDPAPQAEPTSPFGSPQPGTNPGGQPPMIVGPDSFPAPSDGLLDELFEDAGNAPISLPSIDTPPVLPSDSGETILPAGPESNSAGGPQGFVWGSSSSAPPASELCDFNLDNPEAGSLVIWTVLAAVFGFVAWWRARSIRAAV